MQHSTFAPCTCSWICVKLRWFWPCRGALLQVLAVAGAVGVIVVLAYLAQPVIQNTIASFPSAGSS